MGVGGHGWEGAGRRTPEGMAVGGRFAAARLGAADAGGVMGGDGDGGGIAAAGHEGRLMKKGV